MALCTCASLHHGTRASGALPAAQVDSPYEYALPSNLVVFPASLLLAFASWRRSSCCCASPCVALVCRRRVVVKGSSSQSSSRGAHGVRVEHRGPALVSEQHAARRARRVALRAIVAHGVRTIVHVMQRAGVATVAVIMLRVQRRFAFAALGRARVSEASLGHRCMGAPWGRACVGRGLPRSAIPCDPMTPPSAAPVT